MILLQLFFSFLQIGLFSVGGGYAAMPLIQSQTVETHHWLTMQTFTDLVTIAEMTPGPIAINAATFVGMRVGGLAGALAATLGCILPSLVIVSLLAVLYARYQSLTAIKRVLAFLRAAVVALIASAGLSILLQALFGGQAAAPENLNVVMLLLFAAAVFALRRLRWHPILVMSLCGAANLLIGSLLGG